MSSSSSFKNVVLVTNDSATCAVHADAWRECAEDHVRDPKAMRVRCDPLASNFEKCVADWRASTNQFADMEEAKKAAAGGNNSNSSSSSANRDNGKVFKQLRGAKAGEPAEQCAPLSHLMGNCLHQNSFAFEKCTIPSEYFKRCVKSLYGSEYVM